MKLLLILTFFSIYLCTFSQDLLLINEKSYPANGSFTFTINSDEFYNQLDVLVAKDGEKGILAFSIHSDYEYITGKVLLYLEDASVVTLIDRNIYDNVDGTSTTLYYITANEIEKLKKTKILKIRFARGPAKGHPAECTNQTADNKYKMVHMDTKTYEDKEVEYETNSTLYFIDFF
jgi:hypothetical protein